MRNAGAVHRAVFTFLVSVCAMMLAAQAPPTPPVSVTLTEDNPIVTEHLILFHSALSAEVARRNASDPERSNARQRGIRDLFGISEAGAATLNRVFTGAKSVLDQTAADQQSYISSLAQANSPVSDKKLQELYDRRVSAIQKVRADLSAQLSTADWQALRNFIAKEIASKIKVGRMFNVAK